jgi:hypothetical protein
MVCVYQTLDEKGMNGFAEKFQSKAIGGKYFRSIVVVTPQDDIQNCDVLIRLSLEKVSTTSNKMVGHAKIHSARSGQLLFDLKENRGFGWGFVGRLVKDSHDRIRGDPVLNQRFLVDKGVAVDKGYSSEKLNQTGTQAVSSETTTTGGYSIRSEVGQVLFHYAENPASYAVIVGVDGYSNDLPAAQFAERDAQAAKNHFLALGIPERNIKFLVGNRATKANLEAYIEDWLPRNVKEDGRVFFYFSGHGAPDPTAGQAYLLPWDGNPNFLKRTAYPLKRLYAQLNSLKAKQVIVALDSCFSGSGGRSVLAQGARPLVTQVDTAVSPGGKLTVFAASAPTEITATLPEQGHGIFTYYFLKGLGGEAKEASGAVTFKGLFDYLKPKVQDAASRQNRDQTPVLEGVLDGEIVRFKQ